MVNVVDHFGWWRQSCTSSCGVGPCGSQVQFMGVKHQVTDQSFPRLNIVGVRRRGDMSHSKAIRAAVLCSNSDVMITCSPQNHAAPTPSNPSPASCIVRAPERTAEPTPTPPPHPPVSSGQSIMPLCSLSFSASLHLLPLIVVMGAKLLLFLKLLGLCYLFTVVMRLEAAVNIRMYWFLPRGKGVVGWSKILAQSSAACSQYW